MDTAPLYDAAIMNETGARERKKGKAWREWML
jgi:hypothetical protein